jgi:hypothetical protein
MAPRSTDTAATSHPIPDSLRAMEGSDGASADLDLATQLADEAQSVPEIALALVMDALRHRA